MREINVYINGDAVISSSDIAGVQGSGKGSFLKFRFAENWHGLTKRVIFTNAKGLNPVVIILGVTELLEDDNGNLLNYGINVPPEALEFPGEIFFIAEGTTAGGKVLFSAKEKMSVIFGVSAAMRDLVGATDVPPSQAAQLQAQIDKLYLNSIEDITREGDIVTVKCLNGETFTFELKDGNGIASIVMNDDYTLTFTFDNRTSYTTTPIRGEPGKTYELTEDDKNEIAEKSTVKLKETEAAAIASIEEKGAETLGKIPENYIKLDAKVDELSEAKVDKSSIAQNLGHSETAIMSQKAVTPALSNFYNFVGLAMARNAGYYRSNGEYTNLSTWYHEIYECNPFDRFRFTAVSNSSDNVSGILVYDENDTIIAVVNGLAEYNGYEYTVPNNGKKICFSYNYIDGHTLIPRIEMFTYTNRLTNELSDVKNDLDQIKEHYFDFVPLEIKMTNGFYKTNGVLTSPFADAWYYDTYTTKPGEKFRFTATGRSESTDVSRIVVFDDNENLLDAVLTVLYSKNFIYVTPENAAKICFTYYAPDEANYPIIEKYMYKDNSLEFVELYPQHLTTNYYINGSGSFVSNADYAYCYYDVSEGEVFRFSAIQAGSANVLGIMAIDNDNASIKSVANKSVYDNYEFIVPPNVTKLYFSFYQKGPYRIEKLKNSDFSKCIACVGDSLTAGNQDGTGASYPKYLQGILGVEYIVKSHGCGGDYAEDIAAACGAYSMTVEPFTIPADTSTVEITLRVPTTPKGSAVNPMYQNLFEQRFVSIGGVIGETVYQNESGKYTFKRYQAGDSVTFIRPVPLKTFRMSETNYTTVIWAGTNNKPSVSSVTDVVEAIQAIVNNLNHDRYIVVGLTSKNYMSEVADVNIVLERKFGKHFVDVREYLLEYGLEDAGITPTEQDTTDIANGEIPTSLRTDVVHFKAAGYSVVANQIYQKGKELGYW